MAIDDETYKSSGVLRNTIYMAGGATILAIMTMFFATNADDLISKGTSTDASTAVAASPSKLKVAEPEVAQQSSLIPPDLSRVNNIPAEYRWGAKALGNINVFSRDRRVRIYLEFAAADLPPASAETGETPSARAKAVIAKIAAQECNAILSSFAETCAVAKGHVTPTADGQFFVANLEFDFTQRHEFGEPDPANSYMYSEEAKVLRVNNRPTAKSGFSKSASKRAAFYKKVASSCRGIRGVEGTCAVQDIRLRTEMKRNGFETTALGNFGYIQPLQ